ncbi:unnamed protein product [Protopolystoma xenopodis]|uniref:Uncharacterized protein n=1 Tax=Protopolystoma xenopodis TaxID=117903 RepID=A0A448X838_9PLAT|nr:unnamed protein product [Protopolystoma xenopodis]
MFAERRGTFMSAISSYETLMPSSSLLLPFDRTSPTYTLLGERLSPEESARGAPCSQVDEEFQALDVELDSTLVDCCSSLEVLFQFADISIISLLAPLVRQVRLHFDLNVHTWTNISL